MNNLSWLDNFENDSDAEHFIDDMFTELYTDLAAQLENERGNPRNAVSDNEIAQMIRSAEELQIPAKPVEGWEYALGQKVAGIVRRLEALKLVVTMKTR